jgi:hypothetical protein
MKSSRTKIVRAFSLSAASAIVLLSIQCHAAITVFMDYSGFITRLNQLTNSAGITPFDATERDTIKSGVLGSLQTAFGGFDVSFSETAPGGAFPRLWFGDSGGGFGVADHIDYRNKQASDLARVFTAQFSSFIETNELRAQQINELTLSLAGTSAHELGHNLGLRHHDSYGDKNLVYTGTPIGTGGLQNTHVMATGSTGLSENGRETQRTFSEHSLVKLAYAAGLSATVPATITEGLDFGDDTAGASPLSLTNLAMVARSAVNVAGQINTNTDVDVFSFALEAGTRFTADINIDFPDSIPFDNVDTFMELIDSNGTTVLASDDVTNYSSNTFGSGGSGDGFDPWLLNVPIANSGTYYLRISPESPDSGDYELLIHTDLQANTIDPDFSGDGLLDCEDIDALVAQIAAGTNNAGFDLTGDGFVDLDDRDSWLTQAGAVNLASGNPYLLGDTNLDGTVDGLDFMVWNKNRFSSNAAWCASDFNADGVIDGADFIIWNENRFMSASSNGILHGSGPVEFAGGQLIDLPPSQAVPEPSGCLVILSALFGLTVFRRPS